jgi:probable HAF family extracellular repeat protein
MRHRLSWSWLIRFSCLAVSAVPSTSAAGQIINLGTLPWATQSEGYAVNDAGQVAGFCTNPATGIDAFRYEPQPGGGGIMRDLGTLGGPFSWAYGINNSGQVTGYSNPPQWGTRAFRYDGTPGAGGSMNDLGMFTDHDSGSAGFAINDSGQVAGDSVFAPDTGPLSPHAFRYDGTPGAGGVMYDLGTLGGKTSKALGINAWGQVVGSSMNGADIECAFRYDGTPGIDGVMHNLQPANGSLAFSQGIAINDHGQVVGNTETKYPEVRRNLAFRYDGTPGVDGVMHLLDSPEGAYSYATGINDSAITVGYLSVFDLTEPSHYRQRAVLWESDGAMVDLNSWLAQVDPTEAADWTLLKATAISNSGWITGIGTYDDGPDGLSDGKRAFLLNLSSARVVPEPIAPSVLSILTTLLIGRRSRRSALVTAAWSS